MKKVTGYKGFNKELKCRDLQYELGKTYTQNEELKVCSNGFHFCEYPLNVFKHYYPSESRFAEVEAMDPITKDDKSATNALTVKIELDFKEMVDASIRFILSRIKKTEQKHGTGDYSAASNTGNHSAASNTGEEGIAMSVGIEGRAMGAIGCWLTLAEWKKSKGEWSRKDVKTLQVDGKKIKEGVWYQLKSGNFVEYHD